MKSCVSSCVAALFILQLSAAHAAITIDPNNVGATAVFPAYDGSDPWGPTGLALYVGEQFKDAEILVNGGSGVQPPQSYIQSWHGNSTRVTVEGPGSSWTDQSIAHASLHVGGFGHTEFHVLNGALLDTASGGVAARTDFINATTSDALLNISGAGSLWNGRDGDLGVGAEKGSKARLLVHNGAEARGRSLFIGVGETNSTIARAEVKGIGSKVKLGAPGAGSVVQVSSGGEGGLYILDGGVVETQQGWIGNPTGDKAKVVVDGGKSVWNMTSDLFAGYDGAAEVIASGGGTINSRRGVIGNRVSGLYNAPSPGSVVVEGAFTTWKMTDRLIVGNNDYGQLAVRNGAWASALRVNLGNASGVTGEMLISGAHSVFTSSGVVQVGGPGIGKLQVANRGLLSASAINISSLGTLSGNGTVAASITNSGAVQPGTSPGVLKVVGNYSQTSGGKLEIELASTAYDLLDVSGYTSLKGALQVSILNEGLNTLKPQSGDVFKILESNGNTGAFESLSLPTLPNALSWRVRYTPTAVSLHVVPEPTSWMLTMGIASGVTIAGRRARF
jgi:T5SS/PEP-CTERM-associated repeat protein